jgi:serine/threonine-protein kinase
LGQYELLSHLATGGMAEIYLARQTGIRGFEKQVVVKRILPQLTARKEFVEMFFDEARIAARLKHPNIVEIYDLGQQEDDYFIAMEYLKGQTLRETVVESIKRGSPLPPVIAAFVVSQVCDGLAYAHEFADGSGGSLGIVHRDVSPNNIILTYAGGVKLVDFGVAKTRVQMHRTEAGVLRGKLSYMSPEQCLGRPLDSRADVFSAGVVLWELLAQRRLFRRNSEQKTIEAVLSAHIPLVKEYRHGVPMELDAIARRAMERTVESRYQDAAQMASDIRKCLLSQDKMVSNQEIGEFMRALFLGEQPTEKRRLDKQLTPVAHPAFLENLDDETSPDKDMATMLVDLDEDEPYLADIDTEVEGVYPRTDSEAERISPPTVEAEALRIAPAPARKWPWLVGAAVALAVAALVIIVLAGRDKPIEAPPAADESDVFEDDTDSLTKLVISSRPQGCVVKVNGIKIPGVTPMEDLAVVPGRKHVVVVNCIGHEREVRTVTGRAGEILTLDFAPSRKQ